MTAIATLPNRTQLAVERAALEDVQFDMYRNIHKGLRHELFGITEAIGGVDPANDAAVEATAARLEGVVRLLISHAEHEDEFLQPAIEDKAPALAQVIAEEHPRLEGQMAGLEVLADRAVSATGAQRRLFVHRLYLGLASFTSEYLAHQAFEELEVTPALSRVMTFDELFAIDTAIVASIPPDQMVAGLAAMLPAMNIDDRSELLGGMKAAAPPEVFAQIWALTQSVIGPADFEALAVRLEVA
jgi:hypothetical protein